MRGFLSFLLWNVQVPPILQQLFEEACVSFLRTLCVRLLFLCVYTWLLTYWKYQANVPKMHLLWTSMNSLINFLMNSKLYTYQVRLLLCESLSGKRRWSAWLADFRNGLFTLAFVISSTHPFMQMDFNFKFNFMSEFKKWIDKILHILNLEWMLKVTNEKMTGFKSPRPPRFEAAVYKILLIRLCSRFDLKHLQKHKGRSHVCKSIVKIFIPITKN